MRLKFLFIAGAEGLEGSRCITDMMENIERRHSQTGGWRGKNEVVMT